MLRFSLCLVLALLLVMPGDLAGQSDPVVFQFISGGNQLQGRFVPALGASDRTVLLLPDLPGSDGSGGVVQDLGTALSEAGVHVLTFNYRGTHGSEGFFTLSGVSQDIDAARRWLGSEDTVNRFGVDPDNVAIGGYGFGGGLGMAYATTDLDITSVFSVSGFDLSVGIARYADDPIYASFFATMLGASEPGNQTVRWERGDFFAFVKEAVQGSGRWDLRQAAPQLARKRVLLIGGLDDVQVPLEDHILPLYRTLRGLGTRNLDLAVYQDDHSFDDVRDELTETLVDWLQE